MNNFPFNQSVVAGKTATGLMKSNYPPNLQMGLKDVKIVGNEAGFVYNLSLDSRPHSVVLRLSDEEDRCPGVLAGLEKVSRVTPQDARAWKVHACTLVPGSNN